MMEENIHHPSLEVYYIHSIGCRVQFCDENQALCIVSDRVHQSEQFDWHVIYLPRFKITGVLLQDIYV